MIILENPTQKGGLVFVIKKFQEHMYIKKKGENQCTSLEIQVVEVECAQRQHHLDL